MPVTANSAPPLNPIENNKYKAMKPFEAAGISKSLLTVLAITPKIKKRSVGFFILKISNSKLDMIGLTRVYSKCARYSTR
jgi:hypothetical protein